MSTRPTSAAIAYQSIKRSILSGEFATGSHLKEGALAKGIGVSRTPVREALRRLAADGVVRMIPNRGAYVVSLNDQDLEELFEMRAVLESFCARLAARKITDKAIGQLRAMLDEMHKEANTKRKGWMTRVAALDSDFHRQVLASTGNDALLGIVGAAQDIPMALRTFDRYEHAQLSRSLAQHGELVDALEEGNQGWASAVMEGHIMSALPILYQDSRGEDETR